MRTAIYSIQSMKGLQVCDQQVHCVCVDVPQSKAHSRHTPHLCRGLLIRVEVSPGMCQRQNVVEEFSELPDWATILYHHQLWEAAWPF